MKNRKPRKDGRYNINISFTSNETSLISWADKHGNFSNYIKKLIEADMKKSGTSDDSIQGLLLKLINEQGLKNIFQNVDALKESAISIEEEKPKANKSKIMNIMGKK